MSKSKSKSARHHGKNRGARKATKADRKFRAPGPERQTVIPEAAAPAPRADYRTVTRPAVPAKRWRYGEGRQKSDGKPFYALRIPEGLKRAIATKWGKEHTSKVRALLAKAVGFDLEAEADESEAA